MPLPPTPIQSGLGNQHQLTARLERMSQSQLSDISRTPSAQLIRSVGRSHLPAHSAESLLRTSFNTEHAKVEQQGYFTPFEAVYVGKCTSKHNTTTFTASAALFLALAIKYCFSEDPQTLCTRLSTGT